MHYKSFVEIIRQDLKAAQDSGLQHVSVDVFLNHIGQLEEVIEAQGYISRDEYDKHLDRQWQSKIEHQKHHHTLLREHDARMFESIIGYGQTTVRILLTINGGAAVAILAFLSRLAVIRPDLVSQFAAPLTSYTVGVVCAALTAGMTYFTQFFYARNEDPLGRGFHALSIVFAVASAFCFLQGLLTTRELFEAFESAG